MLRNTFCHIPGIGEKTEKRLWSAGIISWDTAARSLSVQLPGPIQQSLSRNIEESIRNYERRNARYFAENMENKHHWRLYRDFQDCCAFVDIETTGLHPQAEITTIVLYDGRSIRFYVNGQNLDHFVRDIQEYRVLVTYSGKHFDVPRIERYFGIKLNLAHIDLRYPLNRLGLDGGLKECERRVGIARPGLEGINGFVAVLLWNDYKKRRNSKALETLLAYNIQDTIALHVLMVHTYNEMVKQTPFSSSHSIPTPSLPPIPFEADHDTVKRVCRHLLQSWGY